LHVLIVIGRIIRGLKIRRPPRKGWNSKNTVDFAGNIPHIRKLSKKIGRLGVRLLLNALRVGWNYSLPSFFEAGADSELGQ
jgi:hypothetical protein